MTVAPRILPVAVLLLLATALAGCGDDEGDRPDPVASASAPASATPTESVAPSAPATNAPTPRASAGTTPTGRPPGIGPTERGTPSTPPFVMPTRSAGAPGARQVVDAFRAAGLPVTNARDRSVDCGPDGAGLGCAELIVTDAVAVYVFPDEANAVNRMDMWGQDAYRKGTVVLSYLGTSTAASQRQKYATVLAGLS